MFIPQLHFVYLFVFPLTVINCSLRMLNSFVETLFWFVCEVWPFRAPVGRWSSLTVAIVEFLEQTKTNDS